MMLKQKEKKSLINMNCEDGITERGEVNVVLLHLTTNLTSQL